MSRENRRKKEQYLKTNDLHDLNESEFLNEMFYRLTLQYARRAIELIKNPKECVYLTVLKKIDNLGYVNGFRLMSESREKELLDYIDKNINCITLSTTFSPGILSLYLMKRLIEREMHPYVDSIKYNLRHINAILEGVRERETGPKVLDLHVKLGNEILNITTGTKLLQEKQLTHKMFPLIDSFFRSTIKDEVVLDKALNYKDHLTTVSNINKKLTLGFNLELLYYVVPLFRYFVDAGLNNKEAIHKVLLVKPYPFFLKMEKDLKMAIYETLIELLDKDSDISQLYHTAKMEVPKTLEEIIFLELKLNFDSNDIDTSIQESFNKTKFEAYLDNSNFTYGRFYISDLEDMQAKITNLDMESYKKFIRTNKIIRKVKNALK